jgi:long-subunit acyl-CoA synthetase (AMP-forming)
MLRLLTDANVQKDALSTVSHIVFGAAPMAGETVSAFNQKFPDQTLGQIWGMTEACGVASAMLPHELSLESAMTVGKLLGSMSAKVVDPDSLEEVPPEQQGEILLQGPNICMGYLHNEKANQNTFTNDGWLRTGDLGRIDAEGRITIEVCYDCRAAYVC